MHNFEYLPAAKRPARVCFCQRFRKKSPTGLERTAGVAWLGIMAAQKNGVKRMFSSLFFGIFHQSWLVFLLWLQYHKEPSEAGCDVVSMGVQSFLKPVKIPPGFHFPFVLPSCWEHSAPYRSAWGTLIQYVPARADPIVQSIPDQKYITRTSDLHLKLWFLKAFMKTWTHQKGLIFKHNLPLYLWKHNKFKPLCKEVRTWQK